MDRVLIAVDSAKGSRACIDALVSVFAGRPPPTVILLHVLCYGGPSAVDGMSNDAELAELGEALEGTPQLEVLEAKAEVRLAAARALFKEHGFVDLRTVVKRGRPAEEILNGATEYGAQLIAIGNTRGLIDKLMRGDVAHQVAKEAAVPVLLAR